MDEWTKVQTKIRLPSWMKARIESSAAANHRSVSAEIVFRLATSLSPEDSKQQSAHSATPA